jgi:hypothetical protein
MINRFFWIVFLTAGLQAAWAFSLLGPAPSYPGVPANFGDAWELPIIAYNPITTWENVNTGPKNWGEGYRRNTPVMYYACDGPFITFFDVPGTQAIDQAFDILNNAFTNNPTGVINGLDGYSPSLSEFPLNSQSINYSAQGAGLTDLKSHTLPLLIEQLGLANPVRYTWTLHQRYLPTFASGAPTSCQGGDEEYLVVQRNFDTFTQSPNQIPYSSYVNNTLYSYIIAEYCEAKFSPFFPDAVLADAVEFPVDPLAGVFTPVAAGDGGWLVDTRDLKNRPFMPPIWWNGGDPLYPSGYGLVVGGFYTGLTRDDVAGLRYLMRANNIVWESAAAGSVLQPGSGSSGGGTVSYGLPFALYTSNYTAFASAALTNDPVTLATLFPRLVVIPVTNYIVVVTTPNIVAYYTNNFVLGNPPVLVVKTNGFTYTPVVNYSNIYANLITTNGYHANSPYFLPNTSAQLVTVTVSQGGVLGNPFVTNTTTRAITLTGVPSGDYYINTNPCGPAVILGTLFTNVVATTNLVFATSNSAGYFTSQSLVTYSTNHVFLAKFPICVSGTSTGGVANATGLYGGIEKIQFVKTAFDSLLGQTFQPITNSYTMTFVIGGQPVTQTFERVVTTPDILFTVADLTAPNPPAARMSVLSAIRTDPNFNMRNIPNGLAGPGTIDPTTTITYNKVGAVFENGPAASTNVFLNQASQNESLAWASFDGTTNAPVVYPNTDFGNLENQILAQLTVLTNGLPLPIGTNTEAYPTNTFTAAGAAYVPLIGQLTWSATGLPSGLVVSSGGVLSGTPSDNAGTYDFILQVADENSRTIYWTLPITIQ